MFFEILIAHFCVDSFFFFGASKHLLSEGKKLVQETQLVLVDDEKSEEKHQFKHKSTNTKMKRKQNKKNKIR